MTTTSGPNESAHEVKTAPRSVGSATSTHPSSRVAVTVAPVAEDTAHHATSGDRATRASIESSGGCHGPARRCSRPSNPSGGAEASPSWAGSDWNRDSRNERTSARSRSRPTTYHRPERQTRE